MIEQIKKLKDEKLEKSLEIKVQGVKRGTNTHLVELLSTNKSPKASKVEVSTNIPQATQTLTVIQITRVVTIDDKVKRNINNILLTDKQTTYLKKNEDKVDNLCGN